MNTGQQLRDAGIKQVLDNAAAWADEVGLAFQWWLRTEAPEEFALEDFRACVERYGIGQPHHVNAWGGLAKKFAHLIEPVGYRQSLRLSAHARLTRTYRRKTNGI